MPPRFTTDEGGLVTITIGIDPHEATHTAVAVDTMEAVVG